MKYQELKALFRQHESNHPKEHLQGYISFSDFGPAETRQFPPRGRTYAISSNNKAFRPNMGGYSIFGSALDGTDRDVRLDHYMKEERGGSNGWTVNDCCILCYQLAEVNEREIHTPMFFYSFDEALEAMIDRLALVGGFDRAVVWQSFQDADGDLENEDFGIYRFSAWMNDTRSGNWDWSIGLVRIYDPTRVEVGDVIDS